jgi:hypothetical protein
MNAYLVFDDHFLTIDRLSEALRPYLGPDTPQHNALMMLASRGHLPHLQRAHARLYVVPREALPVIAEHLAARRTRRRRV